MVNFLFLSYNFHMKLVSVDTSVHTGYCDCQGSKTGCSDLDFITRVIANDVLDY